MDFELSSEQQLLSDTIQRFVAQEYDFQRRREIMRSPDGWSREVWSKLGQMGLLGLQISEAHGGMGISPIETMVTMNAVGRGLMLEPYLSSAVLGTGLIRELGSASQQKAHLPPLAAGERIAVPAHFEEGARYQLERVATSAVRTSHGYTLQGRKAIVPHAAAADLLIVSARTSGAESDPAGISLFLVERGAPGVTVDSYTTLDGQRAGDVSLREVRVPRESLLGSEGGAFDALSALWDVGTAALTSEAVGALQAAFDATVEYAKTRKQFGVPIGKFQALQHRMVDMLIQVEQAKSMSYLAAIRCMDPNAGARRRAISAAKVLVGEACRRVGQEAVQLHGGIGMTDEYKVSHYFKRLAAIEISFGDTQHHLERFTQLPDPEASRRSYEPSELLDPR